MFDGQCLMSRDLCGKSFQGRLGVRHEISLRRKSHVVRARSTGSRVTKWKTGMKPHE